MPTYNEIKDSILADEEKKNARLEWWKKNKNYVFNALLVIAGLFVGNTDRISSSIFDLLPDNPALTTKVEAVEEKLLEIELRVTDIEEVLYEVNDEPTDSPTSTIHKIPIK